MKAPARILVVDDEPVNRDIMETRLAAHGYTVLTANDGLQAIEVAKETRPDLILLDVNMPNMDGMEVCRRLRADPEFPFVPIIMVTARTDGHDVVAGLEAGADEYLPKPVDHAALVARVKSMLRIKELHDTVQTQARELAAHAVKLLDANETLEARVKEQVGELERVGRMKRFFSPQLVEALVSSGGEAVLQSHRREITVVFCDLRGFTSFAEEVEPEELMSTLSNYHAAMGKIIFQHQGTLERFTGDGLMVFFNDPQPVDNHPLRAVEMAVAMIERMQGLTTDWKKRGHELGFGLGIAMGYATLGMIGFEGRIDYGAIGPVTNLAARLCDEAKNGEILISQRVFAAVEGAIDAAPTGELKLKGFNRPITAFKVLGVTNESTQRTVRTPKIVEKN